MKERQVGQYSFSASLFIPVKFQGSGTGTKALQLLERVSVERFGAKVVTLDTLAYVIIESECKTYHLEDTNVPSRNVGWYGRKGYRKFRVSCSSRPSIGCAD